MMKKSFTVVSAASLLVLSACGGNYGSSENENSDSDSGSGSNSGGGDASYTLQVGIVVSENDPMYAGLEQFKENVEEETDGDLEVELFPNSSLGDTPGIQEQAKAGSNVGTLSDAAILGDYQEEIGILQGPYLFENYDEIQKVTNSDLFQGWSDDLAENENLQILSFNWYQGTRNMVTDNAIETPEDLNGQSIRTIGSDIFLETMKAMGANPTGLDWAEVYTGIQQGAIDGAEAQQSAAYEASLYEVSDHYSKTKHIQLITGLVVSADWFEGLPEEYQDIVLEEAKQGGTYASEQVIDTSEEYESQMEDEGMTIVEPELEPFQQATEDVYEEFDGYPELREEILEIIES